MASLPLTIEDELLEEPVEDTGIDVAALVDALKREHDAAQSKWELIQQAQEHAQAYYEAKPFGNEVDGRSQIVLPDVQETIDYMAVSMRTFVSGDRVVQFEATNEEDEGGADEATSAVRFNFMRQQDGYRVLHDWCMTGLLSRYGVAKTMMVTEEKVIREAVTITDPIELEGLGGEIEDITDNGDGSATVSLKMERIEKRFVDVSLPTSEFRFSPRARHEDEADYLAHVVLKTRSDLVAMGFERGQVYGLSPHNYTPETTNDQERWWKAESTAALQEVLLCEEYARIDIDDDGIAERVKVFRVENDVLRWEGGELAIETVEEQPFSVFCPFPRPHRIEGWSLADKVMDIQLARSTIARQLMDGMYNANMPRPVVSETGSSENTMDDILSPVPGAPIRVRDVNTVTSLRDELRRGQVHDSAGMDDRRAGEPHRHYPA
ncbi:portal protein [Sphingomonas sp. MMS24-JH45]